MKLGIYEQLISKLISSKLETLSDQYFYLNKVPIDKQEASEVLSSYLSKILEHALNYFNGNNKLDKQLDLVNKVIYVLQNELDDEEFAEDLLIVEPRILKAVLQKVDFEFVDFEKHLKEITPYTGLTHSELFTGSNVGLSLESEIKKEILSSNKIYFLVSFIKWTGLRIFEKELQEFTSKGGELRIITTSYMGATDLKAVKFLSKLTNTQVKVSYNTKNERLHAKAYLFYRDTGFHTGYIGSSNISHSALTNGLEWNLKVTTHEIPHIIDKFKKTFDSYWQDREFEFYDSEKSESKLMHALSKENLGNKNYNHAYFDIKPFPYQIEILEKLNSERVLHMRYKNLIVAATGTGKTVISAFDYKSFRANEKRSRLLFLAHKKEILQQAQATFQGIIRDNNFGELWVDGIEPNNFEYVFASVQTLNNRLQNTNLSPTFFDFIIVDEVHHIAASSYRPIINYFNPKILLGLTATPERMDGEDILIDFSNSIAAEIRLPEALNRKLLCPFQYFGITDSVDLSKLTWRNGRYLPSELTKLYTSSDKRVGEILFNMQKYLTDINDVRALCFCTTQEHASFMAEKFSLRGLRADYLVSSKSGQRESLKAALQSKQINYLFVVDIFNEGIDIPEIDTVLFLRPTESLTVFLQQLGRGLRLTEGKECLTVLDFVGNARPEYDYEGKFRALVGKTNTSIYKEINDNFPHLPLGCSIVLEKKAKEFILENIKHATYYSKNQLINKLRNFRHQTNLPLTLKSFSDFLHIPLQLIYKRGSWKRLCYEAGLLKKFEDINENVIYTAIYKKWLSCSSISYFSFILRLAKINFNIEVEKLGIIERMMCLMLHYDIWQTSNNFNSLEESIAAIGQNKIFVEEIIEVLEILIDKIDFIESDINLPFKQPLKLHSRYTREQILVAFGLSTFDKKSPNREGVAENKKLNTELLFIDLIKSEKDFSPTTLYDDYAITDTLFHWQSQNATIPEKGKGFSYINQAVDEKKILLFVREKNKDEYGNTMSYVFIGEGQFVEFYGSKPMNITWRLEEPIPPYLWKVSAKMAVG